MESLVDLAVCVDQVRVVCCQHVVHAEIDVDASYRVFVLQQRHFDSWNIAESSILCNLLNNSSALTHKLVLIIGHTIVKNDDNIDVAACRPETVHATTRRADRDLAIEQMDV